ASQLLVALESTSPVKRWAYRAAMAAGRRAVRRLWEAPRARARGPRPGWATAGAWWLARAVVFRWLLDQVRLPNTPCVLWSGAPLPVEVAALWQIWGMNLLEVYGQTEAGGAILSGQRGLYPRPGDVGSPAPNVRISLDPDGEIVAASPHFFGGYWRDSDATAA